MLSYIFRTVLTGFVGTFLTVSAWLSGFAAHGLRMVIAICLWHAVGAGQFSSPAAFNQMVSYSILTIALWSILDTRIVRFIDRDIRSGGIEYMILRPQFVFAAYFFQAVGRSLANLMSFAMPFIFFIIFFAPQSFTSIDIINTVFFFGLWILSIIFFGLVDCFVGFTAFWTTSSFGLDLFKENITRLFGGVMIPFSIYPPFLKDAAEAMPFRLFLGEPVHLLVLGAPAHDFIQLAGFGLVWIGVMFLALWGLCKIAQKQVSITGS